LKLCGADVISESEDVQAATVVWVPFSCNK
jgi:hypothetical protein